MKMLKDVDIASKTVLIRVDYNVPYNSEMNVIVNDVRITSTLPTINYCIEKKCKIILISHMGRPGGAVTPQMSLEPVATLLSKILNREVQFIKTPIGKKLKEQVDSMKSGDIFMLENIRFYPGEEKNDDKFAKRLAMLADVYINDAFAAAHNRHTSICAVTKYMKESCAGFLLTKEIEYFENAMAGARRPLCAIIGGSKVSTKLTAILNILPRVDSIIVGGGMAFTFLKSIGHNIGKSICEEELLEAAATTIELAHIHETELLLPVDVVAVKEFNNDSPVTIAKIDEIPEDQMGLDIGPETIKLFSDKIKEAHTIIFNGPMGVFEMSNFSKGTNAIAKAIAQSDCFSIVGGGDSITAIHAAGVEKQISYLSTGGGAFLSLLEGKVLPGIAVLEA
ncbi:MAG: phosphoglycerate kinase [Leptospirales bacterium]|nr:phosphoglycerate kinase [Leptospirales bacterium]